MPDTINTLDLHFQECPRTIVSYLLPHADGAALIETGPGSTFPMLQARLAEHGLTPNDITEVLLTHVHLDHAGAAGRLADAHGARIYVHHAGAPHLADPTKLLSSAERIYGDDMDRLWGPMRPVPEDQLVALDDEEIVELGDRQARALDTPGHASHHLSYVVGDVCFTGDVGGVRLPGASYVELPLAPPEIRLDHWRESINRLRSVVHECGVTHLAPTHFGLYDDVTAHLDQLADRVDEADDWARRTLPHVAHEEEALREATITWMRGLAAAHGVEEETWELYELANPSWMGALGLKRYWSKYLAAAEDA